jgi:hypothetical protein
MGDSLLRVVILKITEIALNFWTTFFMVFQGYALILAQNVLGNILGDFFHELIWSP